jgi:hypothetical protein
VFARFHSAISRILSTSRLRGGVGYEHVFYAVFRTSIGAKFGIVGAGFRLFVSAEFIEMIKTNKDGLIVNFLLSSMSLHLLNVLTIPSASR